MKTLIQSAVFKMTVYYLAMIVGLSMGFSLFLYHVSSNELDRGLRRPGFASNILSQDFEQFRQDRMDEAHANLIFNLLAFNLFILLAGGIVSYVLAQRTLRPIEEAMEAQSRFTADASHELRTPLTAMQTEIEVALRKRDLSAVQAKDLLQSNLEEVSKLRALSEGLLKLASNGDQALHVVPISLEDVTIEAVTNIVKAAQAKDISIENNVRPLTVLGDRIALTETLNILLDNAIKYSPKETTVTLSSQQTGHHVTIQIQDEGQGIAKNDLPHIFDRFYRSDQSRTKNNTEGYGLGLSIAKRLAELQGGTIGVSSTTGSGSTFSVTLPVAPKTV